MRRTAIAIAGILLALATMPAAAGDVSTELVSVPVAGLSGVGASTNARVSADGRYVAFQSSASNLVTGDNNARADIFLRDRSNGTILRVNVLSDGTQANSPSASPSVSADGGFVAFSSFASNLVGNDADGSSDVFVWDRDAGAIELISVAIDGSAGNGPSDLPSISENGRYVAFQSSASNLVENDDDAYPDVFVRDRQTDTTVRVTVAAPGGGSPGESGWPSISADGSLVAFRSYASNLVPGDTNGTYDVFVAHWQNGEIKRVSVSSDGDQASGRSEYPTISADGRLVAFQSGAANLVADDANGMTDIFVHDLSAGTTERVSLSSDGGDANGNSERPSLSGDGKLIAFQSGASDLVAGDSNNTTDVFVRDLERGTSRIASLSADGTQANQAATFPDLAADGTVVAFESSAGNLVPGDTNGRADVFVRALDQDTKPPVTAVDLSGDEGEKEWFTSAVQVTLLATDEGGSGVKEIVYSVNGAQHVDSTTVEGDNASFSISAEGVSAVTFFSRDNAGNVEDEKKITIKVDRTAPVSSIKRSGVQGKNGWFTSEVEVVLSATDQDGSGVKEIVYWVEGAQLTEETVVPGASASITVEVEGVSSVAFFSRDEAGNNGDAQTVTFKVDATPPVIEIESPSAEAYLLESELSASYLATDLGSGLESCAGTLPNGDSLDTSLPGARTFTVVAEDQAGNTATEEVEYQIGYGMTLLGAATRTVPAGAILPVRLVIVDDKGTNRSSVEIAVKATGLDPEGVLEAAGSANPDDNFRYDAALAEGGGYIYNLSAKNLSPGSYRLEVTVAGDPTPHFVPFAVGPVGDVTSGSRGAGKPR